jgi:hypothetical protein
MQLPLHTKCENLEYLIICQEKVRNETGQSHLFFRDRDRFFYPLGYSISGSKKECGCLKELNWAIQLLAFAFDKADYALL